MGVYGRAVTPPPHEYVEGIGSSPSLEVERKFLPLFGGDPGLEMRDHLVNAILEDAEIPFSWTGGGRPPTWEDGLRQVEIVTAIERAADTGDVVHLGTPLTV